MPLKDKIEWMKEHLKKLKIIEERVEASEDRQVSTTDPDCRLIKSSDIGRTVGYNVQAAVDTQHHLIVAHEVNNALTDRAQLCHIGQQAQSALQEKAITLVADKGYFSGEEIKKTHGVQLFGRTEEVREEFYVITVERRITHPAIAAIADFARHGVLA